MFSTEAYWASASILALFPAQERSTAHCTRAGKKPKTDDARYRHFRVAREERRQLGGGVYEVFLRTPLATL